MDPEEDAYGEAIRAHHEGRESFEIVERDDGFVGPSGHPSVYFSTYEEWSAAEREAVDRAEGRVLDAGCGAGRHALYLQEGGHDVVGIDASPGAIEVARDRGLDDARVLDVADADELDGEFETVLMLGNNFGLVGTRETAPDVLDALDRVTTDDARIYAESTDPHATDDPAHFAYHEKNRERGRLPGALRIRIRFKTYATDWFDYLLASPSEMREVVSDTPWRVEDVIDGEEGRYVGVLTKT